MNKVLILNYNGYDVYYSDNNTNKPIVKRILMSKENSPYGIESYDIFFDPSNEDDVEKIKQFAKHWIDSYRTRKVSLSSLAVALFPSHARLTPEDKDVLNQASDFIKEISAMGNVTEGERMLADKLKEIADRF